MLLHLSNIFSILWSSGHIVWLIQSFQKFYILPFHRFPILSFQGYDTNFHLNPIYFFVLKSLLKKLCYAWLILSFQGTYIYFHLKLVSSYINFLVWKNLKWIMDNTVWPILSFQGSYINFYLNLICFWVWKSLFKNFIKDNMF